LQFEVMADRLGEEYLDVTSSRPPCGGAVDHAAAGAPDVEDRPKYRGQTRPRSDPVFLRQVELGNWLCGIELLPEGRLYANQGTKVDSDDTSITRAVILTSLKRRTKRVPLFGQLCHGSGA
jgi:hypothetical protein